jgi:hypothetical protein
MPAAGRPLAGPNGEVGAMETNHPRRREPSAVLSLLWALLWLAMWFWAIIGVLFVVLGALSFFVDLNAWKISISGLDGRPVQTAEQKWLFVAAGAVTAAVGIAFLWLTRERKQGERGP